MNKSKSFRLIPFSILIVILSFFQLYQCQAQSKQTFFKSKGILVRYLIPLYAEPQNGIELLTDLNSLEVTVSEANGGTNKDYAVNETKGLMGFLDPPPNSETNLIMSLPFIDGDPIVNPNEEIAQSKLQGFVFRTDGSNHLSLGVVTSDNAEMYLVPRLVSISPSGIKLISDNLLWKIDLDAITPNIISTNKWPFSSSTNVIVYENSNGFLKMKGTIEYLINPIIGGVQGSSLQMTQLVSSGSGYLNLGKGTIINIQNLSKPIELMNNDGTLITTKNGIFLFNGSKWQEQNR